MNSLQEKLVTQVSHFKTSHQNDGLNIEGIRLLIQIEKERRAEQNLPSFNCDIILRKDLDSYLEQIKKLPTNDGQEYKFQLIVKNSDHHTTIDFLISEKEKKCMVLDAAGDMRGFEISFVLSKLQDANKNPLFNYIYTPSQENKIQKDYHSCPMFAFDHACNASLSNIFSYVDNRPNVNFSGNTAYFEWIEMPPQMVWNAQTSSWLQTYAEQHKDEMKTTPLGFNVTNEEYIKNNEIKVIKNGVEKNENHAVELLLARQKDIAIKYIENNTVEKLEKIVDSPTINLSNYSLNTKQKTAKKAKHFINARGQAPVVNAWAREAHESTSSIMSKIVSNSPPTAKPVLISKQEQKPKDESVSQVSLDDDLVEIIKDIFHNKFKNNKEIIAILNLPINSKDKLLAISQIARENTHSASKIFKDLLQESPQTKLYKNLILLDPNNKNVHTKQSAVDFLTQLKENQLKEIPNDIQPLISKGPRR